MPASVSQDHAAYGGVFYFADVIGPPEKPMLVARLHNMLSLRK